MSRLTIDAIKRHLEAGGDKDLLAHESSAVQPLKIVPDVIKEVVQRDPLKSMQGHVADMGMSKTMVCKNINKAGEKSLVRTERPI